MALTPRDILGRDREGDRRGPCRVFVVLDTKAPDADLLGRLESLGLDVERTIGNKLIGTLAADRLDALRSCPGVLEVELSRPTKPSED